MCVRWTKSAADDLEAIVNFVRADNTEAARRVARKLYMAAQSLNEMPRRGRAGQVEGTRELIVAPFPYIVVYQVTEQEIRIIRIRHAAQEWPCA